MKDFISVKDLSVRLGGDLVLKVINWTIKENENWFIMGENGAGKSTLVRALWGGVDPSQGEVVLKFVKKDKNIPVFHKDKIGYVAFELIKNLKSKKSFIEEQKNFSGQVNDGKVIDFIGLNEESKLVKNDFYIFLTRTKKLLQKEFKSLSTGELKRILILRALIKKPKLLILDEPFDGLDKENRVHLKKVIEDIGKQINLILVLHNPDEYLSNFHKVLELDKGKVRSQYKIEKFFKKNKEKDLKKIKIDGKKTSKINLRNRDKIIEFKNVSVAFKKEKILEDINFKIFDKEHTAILGPNGAGKSTIINLMTKSNLQVYKNNIKIFSNRSKSGQSLYDLRKKFSLVSEELNINYLKNIKVKEVIASGFYDSIGLYRMTTPKMDKSVNYIIKKFKINKLANKAFMKLSKGQRKKVLIARALVKNPKLLILDEPMLGLDLKSKRQVKNLIDKIIELNESTVIFITNREEELPNGIKKILFLKNKKIEKIVNLPKNGICSD